ncbi:hypothetical protein VM1G_08268 [Cytospora mali]|uniref:Uncharacterized protein n=1 Tax=Cytospora mali TaxID=578113 RepID=A0A194W9C6_CYTMA|nr:hypothetical protein VM1G_08268 [Valsa mali]
MDRSPSPNGSDANQGNKSSEKTLEVANNLSAAFELVKPVNGVYQQEITRSEAPDIFIKSGIGLIALPLTEEQAQRMVSAASEGQMNLHNANVSDLSKKPACVFSPDAFDVKNPLWEKYVQELAVAAAEGLGLDGSEVKPELDALWLWTTDCLWTTPLLKSSNKGARRTWAGTMLIVLPSVHQGGDLEMTDTGKVNPKSWSTADYRQSMICWHRDTRFLKFKAPSSGDRLGLLYDLHVPKPTSYNQLMKSHRIAVQAVQDAVEKYTVLVRSGTIEETAFLLPLITKIPQARGNAKGGGHISKDKLLPADLAKIECFYQKGMAEIRGFTTHLALVWLTSRDKWTIYPVQGEETIERPGTQYILGDIVDVDGGLDGLAEPFRNLEGATFGKENVLHAYAFESGVTRLTAKRAGFEEQVFVKTVLCLMMHFERMD